jgi:BirA family biotin operon repressor/biotin-[acetyl-CoA-carboxylase] ligase
MRLDIRCYQSVTSTMDVAAQAAEAGAPEGVVIVADAQTAGRGRRGRSWSSPPGAGLYLSFVLRPALDHTGGAKLSLLTLGAGVAVRAAIEEVSSVAAHLKWPNDVMIGRRKVAGILAEGLDLGAPRQAVILGIGINITSSQHPSDVAERATSLEAERGAPVDRTRLRDETLRTITDVYRRLRTGDVDDILRAWREAAPSVNGAVVEWDSAGGVLRGTTAGIDGAGALMIRTAAGIERVISGNLRWL